MDLIDKYVQLVNQMDMIEDGPQSEATDAEWNRLRQQADRLWLDFADAERIEAGSRLADSRQWRKVR